MTCCYQSIRFVYLIYKERFQLSGSWTLEENPKFIFSNFESYNLACLNIKFDSNNESIKSNESYFITESQHNLTLEGKTKLVRASQRIGYFRIEITNGYVLNGNSVPIMFNVFLMDICPSICVAESNILQWNCLDKSSFSKGKYNSVCRPPIFIVFYLRLY